MSRPVFALSLLSCLAAAAAGISRGYSKTLEANAVSRKEKLTHIHFFWHDIFAGPNLSAVVVVPPQSNSSTFFGSVTVINDALTIGPDLSSGIIGRAQGLYVMASQEAIGALVAMNFVFMEGEFKGSTLTVLGGSSITMKVRELSVIGGTGAFRFARGYTQARTYQFDTKTMLTVVEYDVYVWH